MDDDLSVTLDSESRSPARARRALSHFLNVRGVDGEVQHAALLIVSELVSNAVQHGRAPIQLNAAVSDEALLVEVTDGGTPFDRGVGQAAAETGRGFAIVETLARQWGVATGAEQGKTVWAELEATST